MLLDVEKIRIDCGTQPRSKIDSELVSHYATLMKEGHDFVPVTVHFDGIEYYLSDGFHRYHAQRRNKKTRIDVVVINGTLRDAQFYSKGANAHGKPMSNEDKRKNVLDILDDVEWGAMSDSEIARHCHVSQPFVSKLRNASGKAPEKIIYKNAKGMMSPVLAPSQRQRQSPRRQPNQQKKRTITIPSKRLLTHWWKRTTS